MKIRPLCLALLLAFTFLSGLRAAAPPPPAWQPAGPPGAWVTSLLVDPKRSGVVYAGTHAGLYRSVNGGTTWQLVPPQGPFGGYIGAVAAGPGAIYAGTASGLFESRDD